MSTVTGLAQFAIDMRDKPEVPLRRTVVQTYKMWRQVESAACAWVLGKGIPIPDLTLETTPLENEFLDRFPPSNNKPNMYEILYQDTPEVCIGLYENEVVKTLDKDKYNSLFDVSKIRRHPVVESEGFRKQWVSLYFRRHTMVARKRGNEVTIYNPATEDFCDSNDSTAEISTAEMNTSRRQFYETQFIGLASEIFDVVVDNCKIVHLDVQKYNDCAIWIHLIPLLLTEYPGFLNMRAGRTRQGYVDTLFKNFVKSLNVVAAGEEPVAKRRRVESLFCRLRF